MRVRIVGRELPGRRFVSDGELLEHVHVAVQVGKDPFGPVAGDAASARWEIDVRVVVGDDGELDVRGPAVHGRHGERFLYLTWGDVGAAGSFEMFRRAKLMIADVGADLLERAAGAARDGGVLVAELGLSDGGGGPLCARVRPPTVRWSLDGG
ncbi:MAG: hypothetical protein H0U21_07830 [Acidimicrobiia bacterium]|nr:hypothetical protein [Acidimicrobiia bacterium]